MDKKKSDSIRELRIRKAKLLNELNEINSKIDELKNYNIAKDKNSIGQEISDEEPEL